MRGWNKESIEEQLKLHKKQNKDVRYNYICEQLNPVWYCIELEKYALNQQKYIKRLLQLAGKMHLWIFLNTDDEQKVYDELGLTEEDNTLLGYSGQIKFILDKVDKKKG